MSSELTSTKINLLTKRDFDRKQDLERRQLNKNQTTAENETLEYFEKSFATQRVVIQNLIDQSKNLEKKQIPYHLNRISNEIITLQKYLANSSLFLASFELRKYQSIVQQLLDEVKDLENELLPKRKFAFKNKKITESNNQDAVDSSHIYLAGKNCNLNNSTKITNVECGFINKSNETLMMDGKEINKKDIAAENLSNCTVKFLGSPSTLHLNNLKNCKVFTGPISTSIFVANCEDCILVVACQQLRLHNSKNLRIYLHVTSRAIMEDCDKIYLAPYNLKYGNLEDDFLNSGLDIGINNWKSVDDFNWLNVEQQSPHWSILDREQIASWDDFA